MNWDFVKKILIRAIHTFAQTFVGYVGVGSLITDIEWKVALYTSLAAAFASILKSIVIGIPESSMAPIELSNDISDENGKPINVDGTMSFLNDGQVALSLRNDITDFDKDTYVTLKVISSNSLSTDSEEPAE